MKEILGYEVDEVAAVLQMCPRTIERYVSKVLNYGTVKANTIGRPINSVAMHPHVAFLIFEAVLEHPSRNCKNSFLNIGKRMCLISNPLFE